MDNLKTLQKSVATSAPVSLKEVSSFPPFFHFGGRFLHDLSQTLSLGACIEYGSSGSRFDYRDYSGYIQYDQLTNYWQVSFSSPYRKSIGSSKFSFILDGLPGITLTNLSLNFDQKIGTSESRDRLKFHSVNIHAQPTLALARQLGNFEISFYGGFCINLLQGKLSWSENSDAYLQDDAGNKISSDWTGMRTGFGLGYRMD